MAILHHHSSDGNPANTVGSFSCPLPPNPLTGFVGRERELATVRRLLTTTRWLTVTGAGGTGKTRLAMELVNQLASEGGHAVLWVELAAVRQGDAVAHQVANAAGVRQPPDGTIVDALVATLCDRPWLLVLDNCEHLTDACANLADALLRAVPTLRLLATSREAFRMEGEIAWLVPPLSLPTADTVDGALQSEAVQLFVERARCSHREFELTERNVRAVVTICRRLDGLPLALELAAARVRMMTPSQIADRIRENLGVLTHRGRSVTPRHRTLHSVMDWSYDLLEEREQSLFRRLSVFSGGFTLEAVEAVCSDDTLPPEEVLDLLSALADKSLVHTDVHHGHVRHTLLDTVRRYAAHRLETVGRTAVFRARHAAYYLDLARAAEPHLLVPEDAVWIETFSRERDNVSTAIDYLTNTPGGAESALQLIAALEFVFASGVTQGYREMRRTIETLLDRDDPISPLMRARALCVLGFAEYWLGHTEAMAAPFHESVSILRSLREPCHLAHALTGLAMHALLTGHAGRGHDLLEEAVSLARPRDARLTVFVLGFGAHAGLGAGHLVLARQWYLDALALTRTIPLPECRKNVLAGLGRVALEDGDPDFARDCFREVLHDGPSASIGHWGELMALHGLARLALADGDADRAARLLGAAESRCGRIEGRLLEDVGREHGELLTALRAALDDATLELARARGLSLDWHETGRDAIGSAPSESPAGPPEDVPEPAPAAWRVLALGPLEIFRGQDRLDASAWSYGKPRELLLYLLCHPHGRTRDQIGLAFWPDAPAAKVKNNFHVTLHHLRRTLGGPESVVLDHDRYRINPDWSFHFDAAVFEQEIRTAIRGDGASNDTTRLWTVLEAYRGDFLQDDVVGDWHLEHRDRLRRVYLDGLKALGSRLVRAEAYEDAIGVYREIIRVDELHEPGHRQLMSCLSRTGQRNAALRQYEQLTAALQTELDTEPEPETKALYEQLRRGEVVGTGAGHGSY